jgi:heme exporter protein B
VNVVAGADAGGAGWAGKTIALARKDLRIEARARETLPPMLAFSLAVTLLLAFALPTSGPLEAPREFPGVGLVVLADVLAGFMWVTVLFAGLIGFARTFEIDRADGALDALLLVPLDRSGLFAAKAAANLIVLMILEVILVPAFSFFFGIDLAAVLGPMLLVIVLVDIGFSAIGTLFASLAAHTRSRELVLPILALPALVPVFIAAVELTSDLFMGGGLGAVTERGWFGILIGFDVVFVTLGALSFEFTLD